MRDEGKQFRNWNEEEEEEDDLEKLSQVYWIY